MKKETFFNLVQDLQSDCKIILEKKANDYATETDVLSAFKLIASITKDSPNKIFLIECAQKMVRLGELTSGTKQVKNESIEDSFKDFINYLTLWYAYRQEDKC